MKKNQIINNCATIWISGVTASGKTTLGKKLYDDLTTFGIGNLIFLDGDELRKNLDRVYGYSPEERFKATKKYIKFVKNENIKGNIVIISVVSHKKEVREFARNKLDNFFEINLLCSVEICEKRDFKNIYNNKDEINQCIPGVTEIYEVNNKAELILDTGNVLLKKSEKIIFNEVLEFLQKI